MRRREFLFAVGSAAVAWPLAVRAEQAVSIRRVAYVSTLGIDDKRAQAGINALKTGMKKLGWIEGKNVRNQFLQQRARLATNLEGRFALP